MFGSVKEAQTFLAIWRETSDPFKCTVDHGAPLQENMAAFLAGALQPEGTCRPSQLMGLGRSPTPTYPSGTRCGAGWRPDSTPLGQGRYAADTPRAHHPPFPTEGWAQHSEGWEQKITQCWTFDVHPTTGKGPQGPKSEDKGAAARMLKRLPSSHTPAHTA